MIDYTLLIEALMALGLSVQMIDLGLTIAKYRRSREYLCR